ncbi:hypothetical protein C0585_01335 [Candidatus Woesearchaeota archaeon]|nr:MAG: hypothetical protein C0585_01335 [Candidatus Woesearchaeota archaeon]
MDRDKGLIIIPVKNEYSSLKNILESLKDENILVVNDNYKEFNYPNKKDLIILENKKNLGKGASLKKGFQYAIDNKFNYVIMMDADGEHPPNLIPEFKEKLQKKDMVFGQRRFHRSLSRKIFNLFASFWVRRLGINIDDATCGYMGIRTKILKNMVLKSKGFDIDIELIMESLKFTKKHGVVNIDNKKFDSSNIKRRDILDINDRYDLWIIENKGFLLKKYGKTKYSFLYISAINGLIIGKLIRLIS